MIGAISGLIAGGIPDATVVVTAATTVAALVADRLGRPRVLASRRQVPRVWGQVFTPPTVGLLFGTRLGIGPSTQLNTWTWWVGTVLASSHGMVPAALVGATFGFSRTTAMVLVARRSEAGGTAAAFFGALRASETRFAGRAGAALGLAAITIALTACTGGGDTEVADEPAANPTEAAVTVGIDPDPGADAAVGGTVQTRPTTTTSTTETTTVSSEPSDADERPTTTTDDTTGDTTTTVAVRPAADPTLGDLLIGATEARPIIADPRADVALDLEAAAQRQPDPDAERPLLQTRGFREGWSRAFDAGDDVIVIATAYRFEDDVEAAFYLEDGLITVGGAGAELFEVEATPGLRGFSIPTADDAATTSHGATFTRGDLWFLIVVDGPTDSVTAQAAVALALDQLDRVDELVGRT